MFEDDDNMKEYCFVIQPYDGGDFDNRYEKRLKLY